MAKCLAVAMTPRKIQELGFDKLLARALAAVENLPQAVQLRRGQAPLRGAAFPAYIADAAELMTSCIRNS
jgi:hypothetical protein